MRILPLILAAAAVLTAAAPAVAQDLAQGATAVRDKALTDSTAWDVVESLTTEVGPRMVGSPAMVRARDWGVATLKRLGFENVHVETFTTPAWSRGAERAEVVGPYPQTLAILGIGGSAPTPAGGITAPIVVFTSYQALLDAPTGSLAGKIAVVTQAMGRTQDGSSYGSVGIQRRNGAVEAAKRGAIAYMARSLSTDDTRLPHTGGGTPAGIPMAALSTPDAELLERMAARGKPVTVRLEMASSFNPKAEAYNVVGEIRGREAPDEVIVVGRPPGQLGPGHGRHRRRRRHRHHDGGGQACSRPGQAAPHHPRGDVGVRGAGWVRRGLRRRAQGRGGEDRRRRRERPGLRPHLQGQHAARGSRARRHGRVPRGPAAA